MLCNLLNYVQRLLFPSESSGNTQGNLAVLRPFRRQALHLYPIGLDGIQEMVVASGRGSSLSIPDVGRRTMMPLRTRAVGRYFPYSGGSLRGPYFFLCDKKKYGKEKAPGGPSEWSSWTSPPGQGRNPAGFPPLDPPSGGTGGGRLRGALFLSHCFIACCTGRPSSGAPRQPSCCGSFRARGPRAGTCAYISQARL